MVTDEQQQAVEAAIAANKREAAKAAKKLKAVPSASGDRSKDEEALKRMAADSDLRIERLRKKVDELSHPAARMFPLMWNDELRELAADIKANGQRLPIEKMVRPENGNPTHLIVDGRNRWIACKFAGVRMIITILPKSDDLQTIERVTSLNIQRRHLTTAQRAAIAAELKPMFAAAAAERQRAGTSASSDAKVGKAAKQAGEVMNVSPASVRARRPAEAGGSRDLRGRQVGRGQDDPDAGPPHRDR